MIAIARYRDTVRSSRSLEATFRFVADLGNIAKWDPSVVESEALDPNPFEVGARSRIIVKSFGRTSELIYTMVEVTPLVRAVLRAETDAIVSRDTMEFSATTYGSLVTYDAQLQLKGPLRVATPVLGPFFRRYAERGRRGLTETLR